MTLVGDKIREIFHNAMWVFAVYDPPDLAHVPIYSYENGKRMLLNLIDAVRKRSRAMCLRTRQDPGGQ